MIGLWPTNDANNRRLIRGMSMTNQKIVFRSGESRRHGKPPSAAGQLQPACSSVDFRVLLRKAIFHKLGQRIDGFVAVRAVSFQCELRALGRPQRQ